MHYSKIYIQDNFVPDIVTDQFRRKVIGIEISLNEGESLDEAKQEAEKYIKDYIDQNKVWSDHNHIEERVISNGKGQKSTAEYLADEINSCEEVKVLESYKLIVKNDEVLQLIYNNKLKSLTNE